MFNPPKRKPGVGDLDELEDITAELDKRLNNRTAAANEMGLALNYAAETIVLAIREQTAVLASYLDRDES